MSASIVATSKFLSLVLRHKPDEIGLTLDSNGWAEVADLVAKANVHERRLTRELIEQVVAESDKKRFVISEDRTRIRANQGHSIDINLALLPTNPPARLFHGTASRFIESIKAQGLVKGSRQHVHLSVDVETATTVGMRHGKPVVIAVDAGQMYREGHIFFVSENGVWLTENVPTAFIEVVTQSD